MNRHYQQIQAEKGDLGGHYNQLESESQAIKQQEQADAKRNGGVIMEGEQRQLNKEEDRLEHQIKRACGWRRHAWIQFGCRLRHAPGYWRYALKW